MIHEEICTYELCKLAKEKGFDVQTFDWYDYTGNYHKGFVPHELYECPRYKEYYAPTQSLLQRWLREKKALYIQITLWEKGWYYDIWAFEYYEEEKEYSTKRLHQSADFDTYELALEDALKFALENLV